MKHSEIDLIARKKLTVIFVEVKFRSRPNQSRYMETLINPRKAMALRYGANMFISRDYPAGGLTYRFDLAVVDRLGHIKYHVGFMDC